MPFTFFPCPINGLIEITTEVFIDKRGYFIESYSMREFAAAGINEKFVQDNQSESCRGTLRGLHFQKEHPQSKLISVIKGEIFDVVVDLRVDSKTYGKWHGINISSEKKNQLYIPCGFAHGFLALSDKVILSYKCSDFYYPRDEGGIAWNDPALDIKWPELEVDYILSDRDKNWPSFERLNN